MNKREAIKLLEDLIKSLYESDELCDNTLNNIESNILKINSILPNNRFKREILLLVKTCSIAKDERREHLKIAIISDLENELRKIHELIREEEFSK